LGTVGKNADENTLGGIVREHIMAALTGPEVEGACTLAVITSDEARPLA
jgi:hypothetical protein